VIYDVREHSLKLFQSIYNTYGAEDEAIPQPVLSGGLEVGLLSLISHEEQRGGHASLTLNTRQDSVVNTVE